MCEDGRNAFLARRADTMKMLNIRTIVAMHFKWPQILHQAQPLRTGLISSKEYVGTPPRRYNKRDEDAEALDVANISAIKLAIWGIKAK